MSLAFRLVAGLGISHEIVVLRIPQGNDYGLLRKCQETLFQDIAHQIYIGDDVFADQELCQKIFGLLHNHVAASTYDVVAAHINYNAKGKVPYIALIASSLDTFATPVTNTESSG